MSAINDYGDNAVPTPDGYGIDIGSQRQDDLDRQAMAYVLQCLSDGRIPCLVELGGGQGTQAVRFARAGANVLMIDRDNQAEKLFATAITEYGLVPECLRFRQVDFSALTPTDMPEAIDILYSQRAIHYVPYLKAHDLLRICRDRMAEDAMIFISAAGYDTEYGKTFPSRNVPLENRYDFVTPDMQEKHLIYKKIVIYKPEDLYNLLRQAGFRDIEIFESGFGNIKASARKAD